MPACKTVSPKENGQVVGAFLTTVDDMMKWEMLIQMGRLYQRKVAGDVDGMLPAIVGLISDFTILSIGLPGVTDVVG